MSSPLDAIRRAARHRPQRLLFAEAADERIVKAADRLARDGIAQVALVGDREEARASARRADLTFGGVSLIDPAAPEEIERTRAALAAARGERMTAPDRERYARDPLFQAAARVREGLADCFVAGASRTTADVLRAGLWLIGLKPGNKTLSSFFIMVVPGGAGAPERTLVFADCAVVPDPTPDQLAEIGCMAADHYQRLIQAVPHTAFLSFSTRGSAEHPRVDKVRAAVAKAKALRPDLHFDGELQLDAAIDPGVGRRKAPDSVVAGHANVLVFPDLDAGNIGYKLVQRLGHAQAYGPMLMGLAKQANDLSRGCSAEDVVETATIACALSAASLTQSPV
jgi:phosphate acetyltransferase